MMNQRGNNMETLNLRKHLLELDNKFCQESLLEGEKAWNRFLDEDAVMVTGGHRDYLIGRENIVNSLKHLYELQELHFVWEPKISEVSEDHKMGYTTGIYTRIYKYDNVLYKEIGKYTTIWKLIAQEWKIVLDIGNEEKVSE